MFHRIIRAEDAEPSVAPIKYRYVIVVDAQRLVQNEANDKEKQNKPDEDIHTDIPNLRIVNFIENIFELTRVKSFSIK